MTSRRWLITCPVWGMPYREIFTEAVLPATLAAIGEANVEAEFRVFTDEPFDPAIFKGHGVAQAGVPWVVPGREKARKNPRIRHYDALSAAHRLTLEAARPGHRVLLLNADMIPSREAIAVAEEKFAQGFKGLVSLGIRARWEGAAPIGADAKTLLEWAWQRCHPINADLVWGKGKSSHPTTLFFEDGENVVCHGFYLYPVMVLKDRDLRFRGTIDDDLMQNYRMEELFIAADREVGFAELSGPERQCASGAPITLDRMIEICRRSYSRRHLDVLAIQLRICGDGPVPAARQCVDAIIESSIRLVRP